MTIRFLSLSCFLFPALFSLNGQLTTRYTVESVRFEGNTTFSSRQLGTVIKLKSSSLFRSTEFDRRSLRLDAITLKNFYVSQGFLQAEVEESFRVVEFDRVAILFRIREGPRSYLRSWTVEGNESIPERMIVRTLGLKAGKPFNLLRIKQGLSRLEEEYGRIGKLFVAMEHTYAPSEEIDYHLLINEGPTVRIDRITLEGLDGMDSSFVLREIRLQPGSVYNGDLVKESQRQIFETGLFSLVNVSPVKSGRGDDWVNVRVEVRRFPNTREVLVEPGISRIRPSSGGGEPVSGAEGTLQVLDRSLFGSGWRLGMKGSAELRIEAIKRAFGKLSFRSEASLSGLWIGNWRTPNALKLFAERVHEEEERFITRFGWQWNGLHKFSEKANIRGGLEWTRILSPDPEQREREEERSIRLSYRFRDLDHPIMPSDGMSFSWESSVVGTILGGTRHYYRFEMDFRRFIPVGSVSVLALRTKLGRMQSLTRKGIPSYDQFYLGGSTSLRGWESQRFHTYTDDRGRTFARGGLIKVLFNAELRIPIWWVLGVDLFLDGGILADQTTEFDAAAREWVKGKGWNYGAELTVTTPLGPIRLYYAVPFSAPSRGVPNLGVPYAF